MRIKSTTHLWQKVTSVVVSAAMVCTMSNFQAFAAENTEVNTNQNNYYYVAMGDSVPTGYGLGFTEEGLSKDYLLEPSDEPYETQLDPGYNLHRSPEASYPYLVANSLYDSLTESGYLDGSQGEFGYFDDGTSNGFHWSNISTSGVTTESMLNILKNQDGYLLASKYINHSTEYYYKLYKSEIEKADIVTVQVGNNDLIVNFILALQSKAKTENNEAFTVLYEILRKIGLGEVTSDELPDAIQEAIDNHKANISISDVISLMKYMQADTLSETLENQLSESKSNMLAINDAIKDINPNVQIVWVGTYNPYGVDLTVDGVAYDLGTILDRTLDKMEEVVEAEYGDAYDPSNFEGNDPSSFEGNDPSSFGGNFDGNDPSGFDNFDGNFDGSANTDSVIKDLLDPDSDTDSSKLISELASLTPEDYETIVSFLESYSDRAETFVVNDGKSLKALANKLQQNSVGYLLMLAAYANCSDESKNAVTEQLESDLQYPLMHLLSGETAQSAIDKLSEITKEVADETGGTFVDISGVPNETDLDPHPQAAGHAYIAEQIEAAIPEAVEASINKPYTVGDVNDDDVIGIMDAQVILDMCNNVYQTYSEQGVTLQYGGLLAELTNGWSNATLIKAADFNGTDNIDATDARAVQNYIHSAA